MLRRTRAALAIPAAFLLTTPAPAPPPPEPGQAAVARLFVEPVPLNPQAPGERTLGPLRYLGGWALTSNDRRFGAISALAADGERFLALADQGILFRFTLAGGQVEIVPLPDGPGSAASKVDRDSEAMALHGDRLWIAYENSNSVWRYRAGDARAQAHSAPAAMDAWPANRGAEAMVRLPDGRFLLIGEDVDEEGISKAVLFVGDPAEAGTAAVPLRIDPPPGQRVTDAALLPDGRLLLLTRGLSISKGWTARLLLATLPSEAGALIPVQEVADLSAPLTRDNMEGLAVTDEGARTIVWLASDDNLITLQRTLLLKFEWVG